MNRTIYVKSTDEATYANAEAYARVQGLSLSAVIVAALQAYLVTATDDSVEYVTWLSPNVSITLANGRVIKGYDYGTHN